MSKHIAKNFFYDLPSGISVHPSRLIHKDGTLMWKHALKFRDEINLPENEAHEAHIVKTAQRLEELNSWASSELQIWDCIIPLAWYVPSEPELSQGISVYFKHSVHDLSSTYNKITEHILPHESLELCNSYIHFKRC